MKDILKKGSKIVMVMLMTLSMLFSSSSIVKDANTATITYMEQRAVTYIRYKSITSKTGTTHSAGTTFYIMTTTTYPNAGDYLYCIDFGVSLPDDTTMTSNTSASALFKGTSVGGTTAAEKMELVSRIGGRSNFPNDFEYGHSMGVKEKIRYLVGRTLIWEVTEGERDADFNLASSDGSWTHVKDMWYFTDYTNEDGYTYTAEELEEYFDEIYDSWVSQIQYEIRIENDIPSFASSSSSSADTVELEYDSTTGNYSTTLTDSNSVITLYDNDIEYSNSALSSSRSGYNLTIKSSSVISKDNPATITFNADRDIAKGTVTGYVAGNYQSVVSIGSPSTTSKTAYLKVYTEELGSLTLAKKDNKGNYIADTTFKVSYNSDMSNPVGTYTTGSDGTVTVSDLYSGTVYIQETSVPDNLVLDSTVHSVTIKSGETSSYTATNDWKQGYIQVTKYDSKTGQVVKQSGVEFEILSGSTVVETITTNSNGIATSGLLDYGTYTIREKTNPENYVIVTTTESQSVTEDGKTYKVSIYNEPVVGSITITKEDSETGDAQGEATLEGATYVLKAKEDILNPATGSVLYSAGTTISTKTVGNSTWGDTGSKTTDENGQITWSNLPMGTYVISETKASTGYTVSDETYTVTLTPANNTSSEVVESVTVKEDIIKGYIEVTKKDSKTGEIVQKAGTEFEILDKEGTTVIETIKTDSTGVAMSSELPYGTYMVREKTNPDNYTLATTTLTQSIRTDGEVYSLTISNEPVVGSIYLTKEDSETGSTAQGDATLEGATYVLKAYEDILDPASGKVLFEKGETISTKTVGNSTWGDTGEKSTDSNAEISWTNLPMGTYVISETEASEGYLVTSTTNVVTLTPESNTKNVTSKSVTSEEDVIKGKIQVSKIGSDGSAGVQDGLEGVEFTIKLYSEVQSVGWDEATTYDVLTTDSTGRATSVDLPYGVYLVKETYTPENYYAGGDFFVTIDEDEEIEYRVINNAPFKAWLKLVKTDEDGDEVTLSNATFKLKDSEGNYVSQKSGWTYIDTWTTDENGIVYLDNMVETGTYYVEEITSPTGFVLADEVEVEITSTNESITFDEDNDPIITVEIVDEKPTGTIILNKSTELSEDIVNKGIKFQLTANSDIIDPTDGSVIYSKGDIVTKDYDDGIYEINENGYLQITGLPLGTEGASYLLTEVETQDGYVLLEEPVQYDFTIQNNTTKVYEVVKSAENKLTETYFSKTDVGGNEVEGAQMVLTDNTTGTVIDEWTSTTEEHLVKGLIYGHEYTLSETTAPDGYAVSTDITFTYFEEMESGTVTMTDKQVTVTKVDTDGNTINGATLEIIDKETGEVVDSWTTSSRSYTVNDTMKEIIETEGIYAVASSSINSDGDIHRNDTEITLSNGVYVVEEIINNYDAATDTSSSYRYIFYVDSSTGETLPYRASNLEVGKTYILQEIETPKGYVTASDVEFTVTEDDDQDIVMTDKQVLITKEDVGGQEVEGATIQVIDKDGNIVDEWVSTTEPHAISGLEEG
ncbi:MAG: hypothetical protein LUG12_03515, partial [Erysipelotrichaceae bacterium]|nr:hypothetical protein [Erysipelotrichaceae bacterium]